MRVKYAIIRKEILQRRRKRKPIAHRVKNVLVTFGGADPRNNTKQTIDLLNDLPEERLNITIVIGPIFRKGLERSIKLMLKNGPHKFFIKKRVLNMADLMARTDLAFCGAGTTMMELLIVPMTIRTPLRTTGVSPWVKAGSSEAANVL